MQIAEAKLKRVFVARLEEGQRLPQAIEQLADCKGIRPALAKAEK